eukprot:Rhum_TRINITY_DN2511_c0_g1::Rhum_TRINITY_DN2511_c0_g1_i1::g.7401::m.7401
MPQDVDEEARQEIENIIPRVQSTGGSNVPHIVHRIHSSQLPPFYQEVMNALGTFLSLPANMYGGLVPTTAQAVYTSRVHLLRAAQSISALDLSRTKQESLFEMLKTPHPLPNSGGYYGFVDSVTLAQVGLPLLGELVGAMEKSVAEKASQLWDRVVRAKVQALTTVTKSTEAQRAVVEEEYQDAQRQLFVEKLHLRDCVDEVTAAVEALKRISGTDIEVITASISGDHRPKMVAKVCVAAYLVLSGTAWKEDPPWSEIQQTVFHESGAAFSFTLLDSSHTLFGVAYNDDPHTLLFELMRSINLVVLKSSGGLVLEALYGWCVACTAYLMQVKAMLPLRNVIQIYGERVSEWKSHFDRCRCMLDALKAVQIQETGVVEDPDVEEASALVDREQQRLNARQAIIDTIDGWGDYDVSAEVL